MAASAARLDAGELDEAVRIATAIRVMLHQTTMSTSLIAQLPAPDLPLLTTSHGFFEDGPGPRPWLGARTFHYDGAGFVRITSDGLVYRPKLGDGSCAEFLSATDWWRQIVFALDPGALFTRRAIVLGAANQDGGAHVDPNPDSKYLRMAYTQEFGILVGRSAEGEERVPLYGYHVVALHQMAYELLNSPALTTLADKSQKLPT